MCIKNNNNMRSVTGWIRVEREEDYISYIPGICRLLLLDFERLLLHHLSPLIRVFPRPT
jgi:hypothetical protein